MRVNRAQRGTSIRRRRASITLARPTLESTEVERKKIARPHILCEPGNLYVHVGFPPSPCASCPEWVPAMLPALGRIVPPMKPFPGLKPSSSWLPAIPWSRRLRACCVPAAVVVTAAPASAPVTGVLPIATNPRNPLTSAPWYGCQPLLPGGGRRGCLPGSHRHPLSVPFDGCCPYPLHPGQILDPEERTVLPPVCDDCPGLDRPDIRQSLFQRHSVGGIDVDPLCRPGSATHHHSQHERPARLPKPQRVAPCGPAPAATGDPFGAASVPRHIGTDYRPRCLHTAGQIPDVV